jgi:roadblock/LC7 domain-containing protein
MWTIYGILNLFDDSRFVLKIASTICMLVAIVATMISMLARQDREDDASRLHLMKAYSFTVLIALYVVMVISVLTVFVPKNMFDFNILYPFILGLMLLIIGVVFIYCEKWGDDTWDM